MKTKVSNLSATQVKNLKAAIAAYIAKAKGVDAAIAAAIVEFAVDAQIEAWADEMAASIVGDKASTKKPASNGAKLPKSPKQPKAENKVVGQPKAADEEKPAAMAWGEGATLAKKYRNTANSTALSQLNAAKKKLEGHENENVFLADSLDRQIAQVKADVKRQQNEFNSVISNDLLHPNKVLKAERIALMGELASKYPDVIKSLGTKSPQIKHTLRLEDGIPCVMVGITAKAEMLDGDVYIAFESNRKGENGEKVVKTTYYAIRRIDFGCGNVNTIVKKLAKSMSDRNKVESKAKAVIAEYATPRDFIESKRVSDEEIAAVLRDLKAADSVKESECKIVMEARKGGEKMSFKDIKPLDSKAVKAFRKELDLRDSLGLMMHDALPEKPKRKAKTPVKTSVKKSASKGAKKPAAKKQSKKTA